MKKLQVALTCLLVTLLAGSSAVKAGGFPGQEMPQFDKGLQPSNAAPAAGDDVKGMLNDLQKQLAETRAELNKVKQDLADRDKYAGGEAVLPQTYSYQPVPPRQEKNQWYAFGELFYVRPTELGIPVANDMNVSGFNEGDLREMEFDYDLSFKVGGGYKMEHDKGEIGATFWHYEDSNDELFAAKYAAGFFDGTSTGVTGPIRTVDTHIALEMNTLDIEYTKPFAVMPCLDLRLSIGPRILWMESEKVVRYIGDDVNDFVTTQMPLDFSGAGPRVGAEARYYLPWDMELFAGVWGAMILGHFDGEYKEADVNGNTTRTVYDDTRVIPNVDMILGLAYAPSMFKGNVRISTGYQFSNYENLEIIPTSDLNTFEGNNGPGNVSFTENDLSFDGAITRVEIAF
ncbi:MAG: hypothetical protein C4541_13575 [Candidatus Auribacter fodinae]|jgi:hypothetical protein|uniref:Uncharacterized protein n=1 Tax=Candidatus Auribacter fodinae TaxID=2093366 RepID=A0A3A4R180_9BACT|nr:MAG: hypothetical protein C4541_13575 [Candidatus Auribacter fodinae]